MPDSELIPITVLFSEHPFHAGASLGTPAEPQHTTQQTRGRGKPSPYSFYLCTFLPAHFYSHIMTDQDLGPTGEICFDLPSPYAAHPCGLLYLPRFIAKCHKHLAGELPKSYQKNFCRGFDRFLSMHLDIDPKQVLAAVEAAGDDEIELDCLLGEIFPDDLKAVEWNREVTHKGQTKMGREFLAESLTNMGHPEMIGVVDSVMDMIDFDEGRISGFSDERRTAWESALAKQIPQ